MKRTTVNLILDGVAALLMMGLVYTGIIIRFALPPGTNKNRSLWDMSRHQWGDVHFWLAVAFLLVVLLHVANHWAWVIAVTLGRRRGAGKPGPSGHARWLGGLVFLLVLAASVSAFSWLALRQVVITDTARRSVRTGPLNEDKVTVQLRSNMTLNEVAGAMGLPVEEVKTRLGLPVSVPDTDTIGRLGRQYGFTIGQARERMDGDRP